MIQLKLREGKITKKYAKSLDGNPFINVINWNTEYEGCRDIWRDYMHSSFWKIVSEETISKWGKPNVTFNEYESSPGLWLIDDAEHGIIWMIWSDLHHKNPWKGTSLDLLMENPLSASDMEEALRALIKFLK